MDTKDFDILYSAADETTDVATIIDYDSEFASYDNERLYAAVQQMKSRSSIYSGYTSDLKKAQDLTVEEIESLALDAHNTLDSVLRINALIRRATVLNGLVGKTIEGIFANCNTDYRLTFPQVDGRNKKKVLDQSRSIIEDFLRQIDIADFIRDAIPMTYTEGNRYYYLRKLNGKYVIDKLPIGIFYMSNYNIDGKPALEMNIRQLQAALRKTYYTTKKKKAIWMKDIEDDIKNNFPYAYQAYMDGESYLRLDPKYAKAMRINNLGRKFGISPIAKVLKDIIVLDNMGKADVATSKMKQRSLIVQLLRKELLGPNGTNKGLAQAEYSHASLMAALATSSSVYTCAPFVEKVEYVSPPLENDTKNKTAVYTNSIMSSLGIGYLDVSDATGVAARINVEEMMKLVDAIAEQANGILNDYFEIVLEDNNIPMEYCPKIKILNSSAMSMSIKRELTDFLYSKLACSRQTAYELIGLADYATEKSRRMEENEENIDEIFSPHSTSYNTSGNSTDNDELIKKRGRPLDPNPEDPNRQLMDQERYRSKAK